MIGQAAAARGPHAARTRLTRPLRELRMASNADKFPALFTDLYQLTMAQAYWKSGATAEATFSLFIRNYPPDRGYLVAAGVEDALDYLEGLRFSRDDIDYLRSIGSFNPSFLEFLAGVRFTGSVRGMTDGGIFFADEPVIEVTAPVIEGQIVETRLVNLINLHCILATKAARIADAARGREIVDFAARRTQGAEAADAVARVGYMAGYAGTSNVLAGKRHGIPVFGTMAHSFVTSFESELAAFRAYAAAFPDTTTLLVDTYDTLAGVRNAITVAAELAREGHALRAVRLDSGDLRDLSRKARALLDEAGFGGVRIVASGSLDEYTVDDLLTGGAAIDGFGIGTKAGVSADAPWSDCVYKLAEYGGRPVLKLSPGKSNLPGPKQVYRYRNGDGQFAGDVIASAREPAPEGNPELLLRHLMSNGARLCPRPPISEPRSRFAREFAALPGRHKRIRAPYEYDVTVSPQLKQLERSTAAEVSKRVRTAPMQDAN